MKNLLAILFLTILFIGCTSSKSPVFRDVYFGMSHNDIAKKGICDSVEEFEEDGYSSYKCKYSDFAYLHYNSAKLHFKKNKLAKINFYFSTEDPEKQQKFSKSIINYLTKKYGKPRDVNNCMGWQDDNNIYIVYIHCEGSLYCPIYINELAIFDKDLNK